MISDADKEKYREIRRKEQAGEPLTGEERQILASVMYELDKAAAVYGPPAAPGPGMMCADAGSGFQLNANAAESGLTPDEAVLASERIGFLYGPPAARDTAGFMSIGMEQQLNAAADAPAENAQSEDAEKQADHWKCPECGSEEKLGKFCMGCGRPVSEPVSPVLDEKADTAEPEPDNSEPAPSEEEAVCSGPSPELLANLQWQGAVAMPAQPALTDMLGMMLMNAQQLPCWKDDRWFCECGTENSRKFCTECGKPAPKRPAHWEGDKWYCDCEAVNTGKFCMECGKAAPKRPAHWKNGKWYCDCEAENTGKFCTECGRPAPPKPVSPKSDR